MVTPAGATGPGGRDGPRLRRIPNWAIRLPIVFVVLALIAQVVLPLPLRQQERAQWTELASVVVPARDRINDFQVAISGEAALIRSFATRGDPSYLDLYEEARAEEQRALERLRPLVERMGPASQQALDTLVARLPRWQARHDALRAGRMERAAFRDILAEQDALYRETVSAAEAVEAAILEEAFRRMEVVRATERTLLLLAIVLGLLALAAALIVGRLGILLRRLAEAAQQGRNAAETARAEADRVRRRLAALLGSTGQGIYGVDGEGRCIFLNTAASRMLGLTFEDVRGLDIIGMVHRDETGHAAGEELVERVLRRGEEVQLEDRWMQRAAGGLFPVEFTASPILENGQVVGAVVVFDDLTGRREAERAAHFLAEAGRTLAEPLDYQSTLDRIAHLAIPVLADQCNVYVLDEEDRLQPLAYAHMDPAREPILRAFAERYRAEEEGGAISRVANTRQPVFVPETTPEEVRAWLSGDPALLELAERLDVRSYIAVPLLARGRIIGVMSFIRSDPARPYTESDLTLASEVGRRAGLAADNAWLYAEARRQVQLREQVLAIVSHDLRNPLNTISLAAGMLLELLEGERVVERKQLEIIRCSVTRANRLIEDLLDVARIESGRLAIERELLDPRSLVEEVASLHTALAADKGLRLDYDVAPALPPVEGDHHRLVQALSNLVGNAIKFTPEGGKITLRAGRTDGCITFSVSDTGPGIPGEEVPHLFDPYWQAARHTRGGAGLGLAIVRGIVDAHEGEIRVDTEPGRGSTFTIEIPAETGESLAAD